MSSGEDLPTATEVLAFVARVRNWIESSKSIAPVMHQIYLAGSPQRIAWDASFEAIPRMEAMLETLEAHPGVPMIGADAAEFHSLSKIIADSNAVQAEFSLPAQELIEKRLRPDMHARYAEGSPERIAIDRAFEQIVAAIGKEKQAAAWVSLLQVLAIIQK